MTTTTVSNTAPSYLVRFGTTENGPQVQTYLERCEQGCRCIEVNDATYDDVVEIGRHDGTASSYRSAILEALDLAHELKDSYGDDAVVMFTVSDGTGMNFACYGWTALDEALEALKDLEKRQHRFHGILADHEVLIIACALQDKLNASKARLTEILASDTGSHMAGIHRESMRHTFALLEDVSPGGAAGWAKVHGKPWTLTWQRAL